LKNKEIKKQLLSDGTFKNYCQNRRKAFIEGNIEEFENDLMDIDENGIVKNAVQIKECERLRNNRTRQVKKIEEHIFYWLKRDSYDIFFGTFTFNDDALQLKFKTRKQNVIKTLTNCTDYIVNIDYGAQTEREHYHSLIALEKGSYTEREEDGHTKIDLLDSYKLGYYGVEKVRKETSDAKRLRRYITKLILHSVKVKQQYISVKKGSRYQKQVKLRKELERLSKMNGYPIRQQRIDKVNELMEKNTSGFDKTEHFLNHFFGEDWLKIDY